MQIESELLYFRKNHGVVGVCLDVALTSLAITINSLKQLRKLRSPLGLGGNLSQLTLIYSLLLRTRFGTRPTR